jgi:hypothetical protein
MVMGCDVDLYESKSKNTKILLEGKMFGRENNTKLSHVGVKLSTVIRENLKYVLALRFYGVTPV